MVHSMAMVNEVSPAAGAGVVTLRSIHVESPVDDAEARRSGTMRETAQAQDMISNSGIDESAGDEWLETIQSPESTHSLLFTAPVASIPFAFAVGIIFISFGA